MTEPLPRAVTDSLAEVVEQRATLWRLIDELLTGPADDVATRLSDGAWSDEAQGSVEWLRDDAVRFDQPLATLRAAADAVPPTGARVTAARADLVAPDLEPLLGALASELDGWRQGDLERGRLMRLAQHDQLRAVTAPLHEWCFGVDAQRDCPALAATAPVVLLALSIETGRDFEARFRPRFNLIDLLAEG